MQEFIAALKDAICDCSFSSNSYADVRESLNNPAVLQCNI